MTARRESFLEVHPGSGAGASVRGHARDEVLSGTPRVVADVELAVEVAPDGTIAGFDAGSLQDAMRPLVGTPSGSGFRRRLGELPRDTPDLQLAHRLADDLPILLRVAFQTAILDHPALAKPPGGMSLVGADQCEGWRSDGTMLRQIAAADGVLQMALTEPVDDTVGPWVGTALSGLPPLPPMATRRRRRIDVVRRDGSLDVTASFRDSYADPDGVERGLHGYTVTAEIAPDGTVRTVDASGVVLPWPECWRATGSAQRLLGLTLPEVAETARTELVGRGTCTHLNDTLRALVDVAQLGGLVST
jgi:hypothetical protein